jgi:hypothetical protein
MQAHNTIYEADIRTRLKYQARMLGHDDLLESLRRLRTEGKTTNAKLGRLLNLPSSRIADIFNGSRQIRIDEMKKIVETYGLEHPPALAPSAESLQPLVEALLPLLPDAPTAQSARALSAALSYGLELLGDQYPRITTPDALAVAARAATARFRETGLQ